MPRAILATLAVLCLLAPLPARAEESFTWSFQNVPTVEGINRSQGIDLQLIPEGILIQATAPGQFSRKIDLPYGIDVLEITTVAAEPMEALLFWHRRGDPPELVYQLPLRFPQSLAPTTVKLSMRQYQDWDPRTDAVGFALAEGGELLLQEVTFRHWSLWEKMRTAVLTAIELDSMRAYSINFLWGPLIAFDPIALEQLYWQFPPLGLSTNVVLYVILAVALLVVFATTFAARGNPTVRRRATVAFFALFAVCWVLYDLRMGAEFIGYLVHDYKTFHSQPLESRIFRDRGKFYQFADAAVALIADRKFFAFVPPHPWPYTSTMQYLAHPKTPLTPERAVNADTDTWVLYERPDITVNEEGRLLYKEETISEPGEILHEFAPGTFIFRESPP